MLLFRSNFTENLRHFDDKKIQTQNRAILPEVFNRQVHVKHARGEDDFLSILEHFGKNKGQTIRHLEINTSLVH